MFRERVLHFGDDRGLVGVLAEPKAREEGSETVPALLLLNAGILHHVGPSRVYVSLARRLALQGFSTLRFDFSGIGDSAPRGDGVNFDEAVISEIQAAMDVVGARSGITRFIVGGICSGADAAFRASLADPKVVGLLQVDGYAYRTPRFYMHHYASRLLRPRSWLNFSMRHMAKAFRILGLGGASEETDSEWATEVRVFAPIEEVEDGFRSLVDRGVRQLHIYTAGQPAYQNYAGQFRDNFRRVDFRNLAEIEYLERADHVFSALDQQSLLVEMVSGWVQKGWGDVDVASPD